jgi:transcriptional regulator with XRE-family HTH domain
MTATLDGPATTSVVPRLKASLMTSVTMSPPVVSVPGLGDYLRHCRQAAAYSRPDLALAADISVSYLTKLEQGAAGNPSPEVIDQLADALKVTDDSRQHLHDLVAYQRIEQDVAEDLPSTPISDAMRHQADLLEPHLVGYIDAAFNVLCANREYARIFRHLDDDTVGNVLHWYFLVPEARTVILDWESEARQAVASLRGLMARYPGRNLFTALLSRLSASKDFRSIWSQRDVRRGRADPFLWVYDLDQNRAVRLLAQNLPWHNHAEHVQMFLGVRPDMPPSTPG